MTGEPETRIDAARQLSTMSANDVASALLNGDTVVLQATARFVPPSTPLDQEELEVLATATAEAIAVVEAQLHSVGAEIDQLPPSRAIQPETGTQLDIST